MGAEGLKDEEVDWLADRFILKTLSCIIWFKSGDKIGFLH